MKLGISSYTYTWAVGVPGHLPPDPLTVVDLLDKAASMSIHVLQIADNLPLDRLSDSELNDLAQRAAKLDVDIEVGTRGIARDHLNAYLQLARCLRSPILRVVVDTTEHRPSEDEMIKTLSTIIPELEKAGVCLAIENHDRFPVKVLARIIQRVGSEYVGICLDTVNSFGALEGPEIVVKTLGPWVVNLHVKDFSIHRADHMLGFTIQGQPAGQGRLDVPWLLQEMAACGRDPNAILELWTPPEKTIEETIDKEDAWATASIEYLRQLIPD